MGFVERHRASRRPTYKRLLTSTLEPVAPIRLNSPNMQKTILIGITGGSGSGKSWLARHIAEELSPLSVALIEQDWYYHDLSHLPEEEAAKTDFDDPQALELDLLQEHLESLSQGQEIEAPQYHFSEFSRSAKTRLVSPATIVVVEGLFTLHQTSLAKKLDLSVFVDTPSDIRLIRRIRRDQAERGYQLERILDFWERNEVPSFNKFVQPQRKQASLVWDSLQDNAFVPALLADLQDRTTRNAAQPTS